jgi:hypothetical protein
MPLFFASVVVATALCQANQYARAMEMDLRARAEEQEQRQKETLAAQKRQFEKKFDAAAVAFREFAEKYNSAKGSIWPAKEAEQLRKALKTLAEAEELAGRK